ncbi:MAG: ABC transporter substrate-binding protein [Desulfurococcaceae archaeon]
MKVAQTFMLAILVSTFIPPALSTGVGQRYMQNIYLQGQEQWQTVESALQPITCPVRGGTLTIIYWGDPKSWNPDSQVDDALHGIAASIFNRLVALDVNYNVIPDLAESWWVAPNASVFIFKLRRNVTWHDGYPFTCADVKWTFDAIKKYKGIAYSMLKMDNLVSVDCLDNYTVEFVYNVSFPAFLGFLAWYGTWILPAHIFNNTNYTDWMDPRIPALQRPIGTGPFKFAEYVKGDHVLLVANDNYFKGRPCIDRIVYKIVPDPVAAEQTFLSGEGDVLANTPPLTDIPTLNATPGVIVKTWPVPSRYYIGFNLLEPIFQDREFRLAIAMSINRTELAIKAYNGLAYPARGTYVPGIAWAWNPNATLPPYDPQEASRILDQLGYKLGPDGYRYFPNGTRLTLRLVIFQGATSEAIANVLKDQLRKVGIDVKIEEYEIATWENIVVKQRNFDIALVDGFQGPDPDNMRMRFAPGAYLNFANYTNPQFGELLNEAATTANQTLRAQLYYKAQEILAQDLPYVPLLDLMAIMIYRTGWHNMYWDLPKVVPIGSYERAYYAPSATTTAATPTSTPTSTSTTAATATPTTSTSTAPATSTASAATSATPLTTSPSSAASAAGASTTIVAIAVAIVAVVAAAVLVLRRR